ncbi:MAG: MaoC family dehydratase [Nitratireductor sp.]|nr:MaoC family dehydratase [Nitratireductor sp.]
MTDLAGSIGDSAKFTKTVSESDVYLYAGITGDMAPNHLDAAYMQKSKWGQRQAHGALLVGFMSTAVSLSVGNHREGDETPVSLGFDRVRFLKPVFFGDTITTSFEVTEVDSEKRRVMGKLECHNQDGDLVAVATHIEKWVPNT